MNRTELEKLLPHREGMLLLDEAVREGEIARGKYRVKGDEWFLQGHFPGNPVVPGVLLCEILAQTVCVLLGEEMARDKAPFYTGLNNVRFRRPVVPGDVLETECVIQKARPPFYFAKGTGTVAGEVSVKAEFSFALMEKTACTPKF